MIGWIIPAALLADALLGDPPNTLHPVAALGKFAASVEGTFRKLVGDGVVSGALAACTAIGVALLGVLLPMWGGMQLPGEWAVMFALLYATFWIAMTIALRSLNEAGNRVYRRLAAEDLVGARDALSMVVTRKTQAMSRDDVIRSAIETLSENLTDAVTAPLMWAAVGAAIGGSFGSVIAAVAYRVINTLDAMWGYRNSRYERFGKFAARLDDVVNLIPAALTASLICLLARGFGVGMFAAIRQTGRDGRKNSSPNSGWVEAAASAVLQVAIGGPVVYGNTVVDRPFIGVGDVRPGDIVSAMRLNVYVSITLALLLWAMLVVS